MPLYEYQCEACDQRFEIIQRFSDPSPEACRVCGKGPVRRLQSSPAIQFKGTGWYVTDYAQKGKPSGDSGSDKSAATDSTKDSTPAAAASTESSSSSTESAKAAPAAPAKSES